MHSYKWQDVMERGYQRYKKWEATRQRLPEIFIAEWSEGSIYWRGFGLKNTIMWTTDGRSYSTYAGTQNPLCSTQHILFYGGHISHLWPAFTIPDSLKDSYSHKLWSNSKQTMVWYISWWELFSILSLSCLCIATILFIPQVHVSQFHVHIMFHVLLKSTTACITKNEIFSL